MELKRFAYVPNRTTDGKYYMSRLKVVKVMIGDYNSANTFSFTGASIKPQIIYILENCLQIPNDYLITEEFDSEEWCKVQFQNYHELTYWFKVIKQRKTLFAPHSVRDDFRNGKYEEVMRQNDLLIKECIEYDEIIGEQNAIDALTEYYEWKNPSK